MFLVELHPFHSVEIMVGGLLRHRASEQITLAEGAALLGQPTEIGRGFDSLGRGLQAQARPELDDGVDELGSLIALVERSDVALVDLELVESQFPEVVKARITRAEVVQGDLHTEVLQRYQCRARGIEAVDKSRFGNLDFKPAWGETGLGQDGGESARAMRYPEPVAARH